MDEVTQKEINYYSKRNSSFWLVSTFLDFSFFKMMLGIDPCILNIYHNSAIITREPTVEINF